MSDRTSSMLIIVILPEFLLPFPAKHIWAFVPFVRAFLGGGAHDGHGRFGSCKLFSPPLACRLNFHNVWPRYFSTNFVIVREEKWYGDIHKRGAFSTNLERTAGHTPIYQFPKLIRQSKCCVQASPSLAFYSTAIHTLWIQVVDLSTVGMLWFSSMVALEPQLGCRLW